MNKSDQSAVLSVDGINTYYDESHIIQDVSFAVEEATIVTIIGRNGVGKTTILKSIIGTTKPRNGEIKLRSKQIGNLEPYETRRLGVSLVPEERRVFENLSVEENLRVAANPGQSKTIQAYERFPKLKERRDQIAGSLSGGEQQMLAIARGLVGPETKLLMLDEPTEGLAPQIQENVKDIINTLRDGGITILLVEQNAEIALSLADKVYIMQPGEIVYRDNTGDISSNDKVVEDHMGIN